MPKMKTHSGCKKRFKKKSGGKIKRAKAYRRHHAWAKSNKNVRQLRSGDYFEKADIKKIQSLMPN